MIFGGLAMNVKPKREEKEEFFCTNTFLLSFVMFTITLIVLFSNFNA